METTNKKLLEDFGKKINAIIYSPIPEEIKGMDVIQLQKYFNAKQDEQRKRRKASI